MTDFLPKTAELHEAMHECDKTRGRLTNGNLDSALRR